MNAIGRSILAALLGATACVAPASGGSRDAAPRPGRATVAAADSVAAAAPWRLEPVQRIERRGDGPGQLVRPAGVAVDAFGRVYVTDGVMHRLQRYEADGTWIGESGTLGSAVGALRHPGAVVPAGALSLAVLDTENRRVPVYDLFGQVQGVRVDFGSDAVRDAVGRVDAEDLAADRAGALYVLDADGERVLVFDESGRYVRTLGAFGPGPGAFRGLAGIAVGRGAELVVGERVNARVQRLDASGRSLAQWPIPVRPARARLPVAVDDSLRIAVADESSGRLWLFDRGGRLLAATGGLEGPAALAFGRGGDLWVAEAAGARVTRFAIAPRREGDAPAGER